jgi:hypothetical protein
MVCEIKVGENGVPLQPARLQRCNSGQSQGIKQKAKSGSPTTPNNGIIGEASWQLKENCGDCERVKILKFAFAVLVAWTYTHMCKVTDVCNNHKNFLKIASKHM